MSGSGLASASGAAVTEAKAGAAVAGSGLAGASGAAVTEAASATAAEVLPTEVASAGKAGHA